MNESYRKKWERNLSEIEDASKLSPYPLAYVAGSMKAVGGVIAGMADGEHDMRLSLESAARSKDNAISVLQACLESDLNEDDCIGIIEILLDMFSSNPFEWGDSKQKKRLATKLINHLDVAISHSPEQRNEND